MNRITGRLETSLTAALWLAAALLLPLAALTPLDAGPGAGVGGGAQPKGYAAVSICLGTALDTLRACPATAL